MSERNKIMLRTRNWAVVWRYLCDPTFIVVLIQCRLVTDGRTDGQTHDDSIYHANIASGGKSSTCEGIECPP